MGDFRALIRLTLSSLMSNATTSLCRANNTAFDNPTYPVPATAIFNQTTPRMDLEALFMVQLPQDPKE
jgi:hypothetical protein